MSIAFGPIRDEGVYDLLIDAVTETGDGVYRDWRRFSVLEPDPLRVADGFELAVYDPGGVVARYLQSQGTTSTPLDALDAWDGSPTTLLLIGPDALDAATAEARAALQRRIAAGGRVVVLNHGRLPTFLRFPLTQAQDRLVAATPIDPHAPLAAGLIPGDLRFWHTANDDFCVVRNPLMTPSRGNFRVHLAAGAIFDLDRAPLLEVAEGRGHVVFCQLDLSAALGHEPAARRVLANLLRWPASLASAPSAPEPAADAPAPAVGLVATGDPRPLRRLRGEMGMNAEAFNPADPAAWGRYGTVTVPALDEATLATLDASRDAAARWLRGGGQMIVLEPDAATVAAVATLAGKDIAAEPFRQDQAFIARFDPLVAGLTHGDLFWGGIGRREIDSRNISRGQQHATPEQVGRLRLTGDDVVPLTRPAYLGVVTVGSGRIVLSTVRAFDYPLPKAQRVLSMLLTNAGLSLDPLGLAAPADTAPPRWDFNAVDLREHANRGLIDDPGLPVRGWSAQGPDFDLRELPVGGQTFGGVRFDLIDPADNAGRAVIALSGTTATDELPAEVRDITVDREADELVFLYSAAWGAPTFTFRVWYEDRARWVPTEPDPFVDVTVRSGEGVRDWYWAGLVEDGKAALPAAEVAWTGHTRHSKRSGQRVGLYMMRWANPHPRKRIDTIDILSPGSEGAGQPFVLAITAATRAADVGGATQPLALDKVLPEGLAADDVAQHYQNALYGVVLLKTGVLAVIHDAQGKPLFTPAAVWELKRRGGGPIERQASLGPVDITTTTDATGTPTFTITSDQSDYLTWTQTVTARPTAVEVNYAFGFKRLPDGVDDVSLEVDLTAAPDRLQAGEIPHHTGQRPLPIPFDTGQAVADWDPRYHWYPRPQYRVHGSTITFYPFKDGTRQPGGTDTLHYEIRIP